MPTDFVYVRRPNDKLRAARLRLSSPSGSGRYMSRQELADAVNEYLLPVLGMRRVLSGDHVGRWERGVYRWPDRDYREGLRVVLGAASDAELGFYVRRRQLVSER